MASKISALLVAFFVFFTAANAAAKPPNPFGGDDDDEPATPQQPANPNPQSTGTAKAKSVGTGQVFQGCPKGQHLEAKGCVSDAPTDCPKGQHWEGEGEARKCIPDSNKEDEEKSKSSETPSGGGNTTPLWIVIAILGAGFLGLLIAFLRLSSELKKLRTDVDTQGAGGLLLDQRVTALEEKKK